jgi:phage terminase small subunit
VGAPKLTDKQQRFCEEYLIDLNATQAAIRAGYSEKTGASIGAENLIKPEIQNYISELQQKRCERTKITSDMVLQELGKIGFSNVQDYLEGDLSIKNLATIERKKADAVSSIKKSVTEFEGGSKTVVEFKLHDKLKALEMIGRHIGFFEKDNEQNKPPMIIPEIRVYTGTPPLSNSEKDIKD